jgi:hypothetical protein
MEHARLTRNACVFVAEGTCLTSRCLANGQVRHNICIYIYREREIVGILKALVHLIILLATAVKMKASEGHEIAMNPFGNSMRWSGLSSL